MKAALLAILAAFLLSGCWQSIPKFPDAPPALQEQCERLEKAPLGSNDLQLAEVVIKNYTKHRQCAITVEGWQSWYTQQKQLFDKAR